MWEFVSYKEGNRAIRPWGYCVIWRLGRSIQTTPKMREKIIFSKNWLFLSLKIPTAASVTGIAEAIDDAKVNKRKFQELNLIKVRL